MQVCPRLSVIPRWILADSWKFMTVRIRGAALFGKKANHEEGGGTALLQNPATRKTETSFQKTRMATARPVRHWSRAHELPRNLDQSLEKHPFFG